MTYEQSVAEQVAARYGIPVSPEVVKVIPAGSASEAFEYPVWDGKALIYPSLMGEAGVALKAAQARGVSAYDRQKKFERAAAKAEAAQAAAEPKPKKPTYMDLYQGRIATLAARGMTVLQIAEDVGIHETTCRNIIKEAGIAVQRYTGRGMTTRPVQDRRDRLRMLMAKGMTQVEAYSAAYTCRSAFRLDLVAIGITPEDPRIKRKPKETPKSEIRRAEVAAVRERIKELHAEGKSTADISVAVGRCITSVNAALKAFRLNPHKSGKIGGYRAAIADKAAERRKEAVALRKSGKSVAEIAAAMGCCEYTAASMLRREKVKFMPRWQRADVVAKVRRMHRLGDSPYQIAKSCQISRISVQRIIDMHAKQQVAA